MISFLTTTIYDPLYNLLVIIINVMPTHDVGLAVIILTIIVKLVLLPLSLKSVRTQVKMKQIQPQMEEMKEKYKDDRQALGVAMLEFYKTEKINPFSSILLIFIQLPIIFGLYYVFLKGLPIIDPAHLYSFVPEPGVLRESLLGIIPVGESKVLFFALTAAITQYFQAKYIMPKVERKTKMGESLKEDMIQGMQVQMRYVFPFIVFFISYTLIGAIALYWTVSNLFAIAQEIYVRKNIRKPESEIETTSDGKRILEAEVEETK